MRTANILTLGNETAQDSFISAHKWDFYGLLNTMHKYAEQVDKILCDLIRQSTRKDSKLWRAYNICFHFINVFAILYFIPDRFKTTEKVFVRQYQNYSQQEMIVEDFSFRNRSI